MAYLERFRAMVKEIESHPLLEVVEFTVSPPASDEILASVETRLGVPLAGVIRIFYRETDGLVLHWKLKSGTTYEALKEISSRYDDYWIESVEDGYRPFAKINILPLEETFFTADWKEIIYFDFLNDADPFEFAGRSYNRLDFGKMLRPFDEFSITDCMAFLVEEGVGDPKVLSLQDHYATWESTRLTNFESYLEFLLVTRGIVDARAEIYEEYEGHTQPPLITGPNYWTEEHVPKLFKNRQPMK